MTRFLADGGTNLPMSDLPAPTFDKKQKLSKIY